MPEADILDQYLVRLCKDYWGTYDQKNSNLYLRMQ